MLNDARYVELTHTDNLGRIIDEKDDFTFWRNEFVCTDDVMPARTELEFAGYKLLEVDTNPESACIQSNTVEATSIIEVDSNGSVVEEHIQSTVVNSEIVVHNETAVTSCQSTVTEVIDMPDKVTIRTSKVCGVACTPNDVQSPIYKITFDDIPETHIDSYLKHVLENVIQYGNRYKDYLSDNSVQDASLCIDNDSEYEVNVNELQVDRISDKDAHIEVANAKRELGYKLYRLSQLSRSTTVNVLSVIIAHLICNPSRSNVTVQPSPLIGTGKVFYASPVTGDCTTPITDATDRHLREVNNLINGVGESKYHEFLGDITKTFKYLGVLRINPMVEDPRRYTSKFFKTISENIIVNNYDYVCRKTGGYSANILSELRHMTLDEAVNVNIETSYDPLEVIIRLIGELEIPTSIYNKFNAVYHETPVDCIVPIYKMLNAKPSPVVSNMLPDYKNNNSGFYLVPGTNDLYTLNLLNIKHRADTAQYTTKYAYVHASGWVVCEPSENVLVMARIEDIADNFDTSNGSITWYKYAPKR